MASLASVVVNFVAKTAGFQETVGAAAASVKDAGQKMTAANEAIAISSEKSTQAVEKGFLKVALGAHVYGLIRHELIEVIRNIDAIPGVPQSAVESIHRMKYALEESNRTLKQGAAVAAGWAANIGVGLGNSLGALAYGFEAAADANEKMNQEAEAFARLDFNKRLSEVNAELERLSVRSKGRMADVLTAEARALQSFSETGIVKIEGLNNAMLENLNLRMQMQGGATAKDKEDAALQAARNRVQAERARNEMIQRGREIAEQMNLVYSKQDRSLMSSRDALKDINAELAQLYGRSVKENNADKTSEELEYDLKMNERILRLETERVGILKQQREWVNQLGAAFQTTFDNAILRGGKLRDFLRNLANDILAIFVRLAVTNPLINAMFGAPGLGMAGFKSLPTFAIGGRPNPGEMSIVGENGPELFVPDGSGTVIPNGALDSSGGGAQVVNHFNWSFGAGVTSAQVLALIPSIIEQTKSAVADSVMRGGGYKKAFA